MGYALTLGLALVASCHKPTQEAHPAHPAHPAPCACERDGGHPPGGADGATGDLHAHGMAALPAQPPMPGRSVYQLGSSWVDQGGATRPLSVYQGHPTVVLMFYGTCQAVCPLLIGDLLRVEAQLAPEVRAQTRFLLVTFDPVTDTPARLLALAHERGMDLSRWSLLHGHDDDVRDLAMALGVQYRAMGNGQFSHSNLISLLDPAGVVAFQVEGIRQPVEPMVARISALAPPPLTP